jgi:hypothetical protein
MKLTFLTLMFLLSSSPIFAGSFTFTAGSGSIVPGTVDIMNHCDDCTTAITLPFAWTLYGTSYTSANVSSNGVLEFGSNNITPINTSLPATKFTDSIFAYWGDLATDDTAHGQGIFTSVSGSGPNRIFNIEWRTVFASAATAPDNIFEVRLYEGLGRFDLIYGSLVGTGGFTTVGVQHGSTDFTLFESNTVSTLSAGKKLTFTAVPEPGTLGLVCFGGCVTLLVRRKTRRAAFGPKTQ